MKELNSLIRDTAMVVSNSEYVLGKPCIVSDGFRASFLNGIILGNNLEYRNAEYRLRMIAYNDLGDYIVIVGCVYDLHRVGLDDIDVEFVDRGIYHKGDRSWVDSNLYQGKDNFASLNDEQIEKLKKGKK